MEQAVKHHVAVVEEEAADVASFNSMMDELPFVAWQSMCVVVLSQRFREEVDVDDGTFTALDDSLLQPVLAEVGLGDVTSGEVAVKRREAMKSLTMVLKQHIRDTKRIFGYYAASKPGDVGVLRCARRRACM